MAQECRHGRRGQHRRTPDGLRQQHGNQAFQKITGQGDRSGFPAAEAEYIGGARIAGAFATGVW